jgi:hypothetical protein
MVPFLLLGSIAPFLNAAGLVALLTGGTLLFVAYKLLKEPSDFPAKLAGITLLVVGAALISVACLLFILAA